MTYVYNADATTAIKEQLMEGRAVSIAFCADQSMPARSLSSSTSIRIPGRTTPTSPQAPTTP